MEILFIDNNLQPKQLPNFIEITNDNLTIYNNNGDTFGIEILVGDAEIYSVDSTTIEPTILMQKSFNNDINNSYSIHSNTTELLICLTDLNGNKLNYQIYFNVYIQPTHYDDFLINRNLPNYDELSECILFTDEFDKTNLVARMLLDANKLLVHKGNIIGIKKFLNFVGFLDGTFEVSREYITPNKTITFTPNKLTDKPTGNYSIWVNNFKQNGDKYTNKNLPNIENLIHENIDDFIGKLRKAFLISMKYFTLAEQDISFIGFENMSNGMMYKSITSNTMMITEFDTQLFSKNVSINVVNYFNSQLNNLIVSENIQVNQPLYKTEIKYKTDEKIDKDIFVITDEIFDDEIDKLKFDHKRIFGVANHIIIDSPNTYVEIEINGIDNRFLYLKIDKQFVGDSGLITKYICTQSGEFNIKITIWDLHNNREIYNYRYNVDTTKINAHFDVFTSHELIDKNIIDIDVTSSSITDIKTDNVVLINESIPYDLSTYYNNYSVKDVSKFLTNNNVYKLPLINSNIGIDNLTDLPIDYVDNYLNIITFPLESKYVDILIRPKSIEHNMNNDGKYFKLSDVFKHKDNFEFDMLFITTLQVYETLESKNLTDYLFITTTESGIDITKELFDLALIDNKGNVKSIYEMSEFKSKKLPVNYDFDLFHIIKNGINYPKKYDGIISTIKSLYPKLINIKKESTNKSDILKYGDVILCTIDTDTIVGELNMNWKVYNSFTGELLFNTNEYSLKYRINENAIYTIVLELEIDSKVTIEKYTIDAKNIISSFNFNNI